MSLRWEQVVIDAVAPVVLGRWWAAALQWMVVNDEPNVRLSTKEKVDRAIEMLAYEPNQAARNLVAFRTRQRLQP